MKWLWHRQPKEPTPITVHGGMAVTVEHTIKYEKRPKPTYIYFEIENHMGERWQVPGSAINGQYIIPCVFPLSFMTKRPQDNGTQVRINCRLEY
jgi:hypothetical protein